MVSVELRDVSVEHDGVAVLDHADLRVEDGTVVALLGASGSGKTTVLRTIAGLTPARSGSVLLDGRDVTAVPSAERDLGMVAQGAPLVPNRDVEGNLRLPLELRGDTRPDASRRARGEGLRFGIARLLGRRPDTLSTGERATAATARAMIRTPSVVLLDEPATHLDERTRAQVLQQIGIVQRTRGTTMLIATNDLRVASALTDRVAVLDRGTVAQAGTIAEVRAAPTTLDVADLVAPAPLSRLSGRVLAGRAGERARLRTAAGDLRSWRRDLRDEQEVVVAVGPQDLAFAGLGDGAFSGTVVTVATTGPRRLVQVDTDEGRLVVDAPGDGSAPEVGTTLGIVVKRAVLADPDGDVLAVLAWD